MHIGRCGSSEVEQLACINTRKACLQTPDATVTTLNGIQITDVMRLFHGDGPQQEFEAGEQKGGNAGCASCSGDARLYKNLAVSLSRPHLSLPECLKKVLQGHVGRQKRNGGIKPFKDLRVEELRRECAAHGLPCDGQKKDLQQILKEELAGIQQVPAMMFFDQAKKMAHLGLGENNTYYYVPDYYSILCVYMCIQTYMPHAIKYPRFWSKLRTNLCEEVTDRKVCISKKVVRTETSSCSKQKPDRAATHNLIHIF